MRIALVAAPWLPVPPLAYGGSEGVIDQLATGFVQAGHDVLLVTTGDSTCPVPRAWARAKSAPELMGQSAVFHDQVEPLLDSSVRYVGEVGMQRKLELLGSARALLNPIQWPEPFGLVMIEAQACGTPVLTLRSGAAPEIVDNGITGFVCDSAAGLVSMIERIGELDRTACRKAVQTRFSAARMVDDHLTLYERLLAGDDQFVAADSAQATAL